MISLSQLIYKIASPFKGFAFKHQVHGIHVNTLKIEPIIDILDIRHAIGLNIWNDCHKHAILKDFKGFKKEPIITP